MTEGRKAGWASKKKPGLLLSSKSGSATVCSSSKRFLSGLDVTQLSSTLTWGFGFVWVLASWYVCSHCGLVTPRAHNGLHIYFNFNFQVVYPWLLLVVAQCSSLSSSRLSGNISPDADSQSKACVFRWIHLFLSQICSQCCTLNIYLSLTFQCNYSDQYQYLGNCAPTLPLTHHVIIS